MNRLLSVLFWSVITAAFIGPGTVTTAALAGHDHQLHLGWALAFSTLACVVLQEAAARLTAVSNIDLGQALRKRFQGGVGLGVVVVVVGAVVLGCAAYEAGNILGAIVGVRLAIDLPSTWLAVISTAFTAVLLWPGKPAAVAQAMSVFVAIMGVAFVVAAVALAPDVGLLFTGLIVPSLPEGSSLVVLGLVGTTVVPYNLFLGSGLARGRELGELRFGIAVAVVAGGVISLAIVVVGTALSGPFSLEALNAVLVERLGQGFVWLLPAGLAAAGLSSAITAPLAAAMTAQSLFAGSSEASEAGGPWSPTSLRFRAVWGAVLLTGLGFGVSGVQPIPIIIVAQALNALVLPLVAVFLLVLVNDRALLGVHRNGAAANLLLVAVVVVSVVLGVMQLVKAASKASGVTLVNDGLPILVVGLAVAIAVLLPVGQMIRTRQESA